ncbi:EamA family transporter RarD [Duodenibacillus massiliensis]|jgi:chloramphenicol-sensitive protein RarD|uniref:EamA family transporter RarD n=1 Tax=Duodenibacillus massiliensis TaxID=1852381 RepID=UPI0023A7F507|nr:EamA family transporter RarD [Duodenibacillus massiliensis]MBE5702395.1 EamA family transporter RarD [Sutterella sp.]
MQTSSRLVGFTGALTAYLCWGFMPVYWRLLSEAASWEVIAHRLIWSPLVILALLLLRGKFSGIAASVRLLAREHRQLFFLFCAAGFAALNWWINVVAVQQARVVELGIGMFLTPLMSICFGVVLFRETLGKLKAWGVAAAGIGIAVLIAGYGTFPWIALGVSSTWAVYGVFKRVLTLDPWISNMLEACLLVPAAVIYVLWLNQTGAGHFLAGNEVLALALIGTGFVTSVPMIAFAYAVQNLPMTVFGFCQYLNPILTMTVGLVIFGEPFNDAFAVPLALVLAAVACFAVSEIRAAKSPK